MGSLFLCHRVFFPRFCGESVGSRSLLCGPPVLDPRRRPRLFLAILSSRLSGRSLFFFSSLLLFRPLACLAVFFSALRSEPSQRKNTESWVIPSLFFLHHQHSTMSGSGGKSGWRSLFDMADGFQRWFVVIGRCAANRQTASLFICCPTRKNWHTLKQRKRPRLLNRAFLSLSLHLRRYLLHGRHHSCHVFSPPSPTSL